MPTSVSLSVSLLRLSSSHFLGLLLLDSPPLLWCLFAFFLSLYESSDVGTPCHVVFNLPNPATPLSQPLSVYLRGPGRSTIRPRFRGVSARPKRAVLRPSRSTAGACAPFSTAKDTAKGFRELFLAQD